MRVSTEVSKVPECMVLRTSPLQEKVMGLPPWHDPGRLQLRFVRCPDSRGSGKWMTGFSARSEEETKRCLDLRVWRLTGWS
jgi:hypothetical protein